MKLYKEKLSPILKWAGGKTRELKYIHPMMPVVFDEYYEPFIGGGAVYFSVDVDKYYINDMSTGLINLYNVVKNKDAEFTKVVYQMSDDWETIRNIVVSNRQQIFNLYDGSVDTKEFLNKHKSVFKKMFMKDEDNFFKVLEKNIFKKIERTRKIEKNKGYLPDNDVLDNIESAIKSGYYMHIRHLHNNITKYNINNSVENAIFFFIRNFSYSGMFRYNSSGEFNVPYGGIGYNSKRLKSKMDYLLSIKLVDHLGRTIIENKDFEKFLVDNKPTEKDFIFLDPPYDCVFSTYDKNEFNKDDQTRLANYLINNCKAKWLMVINNTDFIYNLYNKKGIKINFFDKTYAVNIQNRNNKDVEHLIIRNY